MSHPQQVNPVCRIQALSVDEIMAQVRNEVVKRGGSLPESDVAPMAPAPMAIPSHASGLARWQPSAPRIPVKREYVLSELLSLSDRDFIENAYRALLRRAPDEVGMTHFLERLRDGRLSKVEVLAALRWSPEGEREGVHVDGLLAPFLLQKWRRKPWVGPVLGWFQTFARLSRVSDRQAVLDAAQAREAQELGRIVNLQAQQLEQRFTRVESALAAQEASLAAQLEAERERVQAITETFASQLQHLLAQVSTHDLALAVAQARLQEVSDIGARLDQFGDIDARWQLFAEQVGVVSARLDQLGDTNARLDQFGDIGARWQSLAEQVGVVSARLDLLGDTSARLDQFGDVGARWQLFAEQVGVVSARLDSMGDVRLQAETLGHHLETLTARVEAAPDVVPVIRLLSERLEGLSEQDAGLLRRVRELDQAMQPLLALDVRAQEKSLEMDALLAAFEDAFRGDRQAVRGRIEPYLELMRESGAGSLEAPVLDLASGRGEWLELLKEHQLVGRGVDSNRLFVEACNGRGLQVTHGRAVDVLASLADASVGAVTVMRQAEHLPLAGLVDILDQALRVLRPGGLLLLHGFNSESVILAATDGGSQPRPLPPEVMRWLVEARGFYSTRIARPIPARDAAQANVSAPRHLSMTSTAVVPFEASQVFNECAVVARKMS